MPIRTSRKIYIAEKSRIKCLVWFYSSLTITRHGGERYGIFEFHIPLPFVPFNLFGVLILTVVANETS